MDEQSDKIQRSGPIAYSYLSGPISNTTLSIHPARSDNIFWSMSTTQTYQADSTVHRDLLARAGLPYQEAQPVYYLKVVAGPGDATGGATSQDMRALANFYYEGIDKQLTELEAVSHDLNPPVEEGALITAREILGQLRAYNFVPPEISWHGGDAVVMLWSFNSITYAVTVTEGEVGYVIRENYKQLALRDSISVRDFKLLEVE